MIRQMMTFACCLFVPVIAFGARPVAWRQCLGQRAEFYATDEAVRIADNVLLYQRDTGAWQKKWSPQINVLGD